MKNSKQNITIRPVKKIDWDKYTREDLIEIAKEYFEIVDHVENEIIEIINDEFEE